jgi:hypothetical protein
MKEKCIIKLKLAYNWLAELLHLPVIRFTMFEIVDLIAMSYTSETRSVIGITNRYGVNNPRCMYYQKETGRTCAFGMLCINPKSFEENKVCSVILSMRGFGIIKPQYRVTEEKNFYMRLQSLHDIENYWDKSGLNSTGQQVVCVIKQDIKYGAFGTINQKLN